MKRKTKKRIKRLGKSALLIGISAFSIMKIKGCADKLSFKNFNYIDYSISNDNTNTDIDTNTITSLEDAINQGFLSNVSVDELKNTVNNNSNIDANIKSKLLRYIDNLYFKFPYLNNAVLNKNLSLLQIKEISSSEMQQRRGNDYTKTVFNPIEHTLYYVTGTNIDDYFDHEVSHMISEGVFTQGDTIINIQFSDNGFGQGLEEELCTVFTNLISSNDNSYDTSDVHLLNQIIGSDVLINSFLAGNIYDVCDSLRAFEPNIDPDSLISSIDQKIVYRDNNYSDTIYSLIGEYFISKETNGLYSDYINYLPSYVKNCSDFQCYLESLNVSNIVISNFKEKRYDYLAKATRDCYATVKSDDTVLLKDDPNCLNSILSNVDGSELAIYNFLEDEYGVSYINYLALSKDDPSDGLFDLLSGQMVFPDEIYNCESADYYIENEGINQKRLDVVLK